MPLWTIHHTPDVFTPDEKRQLAETVTEHYHAVGLPRFYVVVIFQQSPPGNFFVGGAETDRGVRVVVEHIARQHPDSASRRRGARWIRDMLSPVMSRYDGVHWEFHVDETSEELWMINGLVPPPGGTDAEKRWAQTNTAAPYAESAG
jgi:phenylpyruvate tautomerase PptA (4-oxalocrotonate tautomerase family)